MSDDETPRDPMEMLRLIHEQAQAGDVESLRNFVMNHLGTDVDATIEPLRELLMSSGVTAPELESEVQEVVMMVGRIFPGGADLSSPLIEGVRLMDLLHLGLMVHRHRDALFPGMKWVIR